MITADNHPDHVSTDSTKSDKKATVTEAPVSEGTKDHDLKKDGDKDTKKDDTKKDDSLSKVANLDAALQEQSFLMVNAQLKDNIVTSMDQFPFKSRWLSVKRSDGNIDIYPSDEHLKI